MNQQPNENPRLDLETARAKLESARGKDYWRSLEDLAGTEGFEEMLHREFPDQASEWTDVEGRRNFLKLMAASLGLAGLTACSRPPTEFIMPYVNQPREVVPGKPLFYATATTLGGVGTGVLVESHLGRPTKVEGNPEHPASLGACDPFSQASVLTLYDPDRSQALTYQDDIRSWGAFLGALREMLAQQRPKGGAGVRILTEAVTSPSLAGLIGGIQKDLPAMKWHQWEPAGAVNGRAGSALAFGQPYNVYYNLLYADTIVCLDADLLGSGPAALRYAREFALRRRVRGGKTEMNRLYVVEPMPTPTGTKADHRLPARAATIERLAARLAASLGVAIGNPPPADFPEFEQWLGPLVRELQQRRGRSLIVAGDYQPPAVHALVHAMNNALGNVGSTVFYTDPLEANPVDYTASLKELLEDLEARRVDLLMILGGNPAYSAPADFPAANLARAGMSVHLGLYRNETTQYCQWHLPESHSLEAWGDARAFNGVVTVMQPLIQPLYASHSAWEVLAMLTANPERSGYEIVKSYWQHQYKGADFDGWWRSALHAGMVPDTALPTRTPAVKFGWSGKPRRPGGMEVIFRPDPTVYDGRFANNAWLQELPKPVTKLAWNNAALMSPATAHLLKVENSSVVELTYKGRKLRAPVYVQPGHADNSVTLHLGYGHTVGGRAGRGQGFNAYALRTSDALWQDFGLQARKLNETSLVATTQNHHALDTRRNIIHAADIAEYRKNPKVVHEAAGQPPRELTLYPEFKYEGYAWGMAIDLTACTGCQACVIACQAENNIPVVGKDQVLRNRDMHWLRVDSYYAGSPSRPEIYNQPVPCMHCETAPCELVCPVQATAHDSEGLNDMVYNRCVGTRYCSNNCPYKVRRFNFFQYSNTRDDTLNLVYNPDVTVRSRGVMEKCTYCVQRINYAKIESEKENRKVSDGEIQTACQAACPTEAIVFGDINDPNSRVARMKAEHLNYAMLGELNTRPRTTYLAALRNPNPEIEA